MNVQTLRYYERRGLLAPPARSAAGYRAYGDEAVRIVRFVKQVQALGFSLREVETLLQLASGGPESCPAAQEMAREKIAELDEKIAGLVAMRDALDWLLATCTRPQPDRECPLLTALEGLASPPGPDRC